MDVTVLAEPKRKGEGNLIRGNYLIFYSGVGKSKLAKAGVAIAILTKWKTKIKTCTAINERILTVELNLSGYNVVLIGVYAPNEDATQQVEDEYDEILTDVLERIGNKKEICLMGYFNGRVGRKTKNKIVGLYGEDVISENGKDIIQICEEFSLKILNGHFQHKEIHKLTWIKATKNLFLIESVSYHLMFQSR